MPLERPEPGYSWLDIPATGDLELTVVGPIHTWWGHWVRVQNRRRPVAVRCRREHGQCPLCAAGNQRRARYVLPVRAPSGVCLVEFGRTQFDALATAEQLGPYGVRLKVGRQYPAARAPIHVEVIGQSETTLDPPLDVETLVRDLGSDGWGVLEQSGALSDYRR